MLDCKKHNGYKTPYNILLQVFENDENYEVIQIGPLNEL